MSNYNYNPVPTRVWSRVQGVCTEAQLDAPNSDALSTAETQYLLQVLYKGNILQYKKNSAMLTRNQRYARVARGYSCTRNHSFATQTQTYTNPNTLGLFRAFERTYPYPNNVVGAPNNPAGPFEPNVPSPNQCSTNAVSDGGILVAGTYADPCTNEVIRQLPNDPIVCSSMSASDVPGTGYLCWDKRMETFYPRYNYTNNNSGTKWPEGYRAFVSAVNPEQVANCIIAQNQTTPPSG